MKITSTKNSEFMPCTISITFETQNELDTFAALFNYSAVVSAVEQLSTLNCEKIRDTADSVGANRYRLHDALTARVKSWVQNFQRVVDRGLTHGDK